MSAMDHVAPDLRDRTLASLTDSLASEYRLLDQLLEILRDQRAGVASDDVQRVDDSVHDAHRVMQTLGEARRRRHALVRILTDHQDVPLAALADALGEAMTGELREQQGELEALARTVSREVAVNRALLTEAIQNDNDYVRRLTAPAPATYGGQGEWHAGSLEPALINRRV